MLVLLFSAVDKVFIISIAIIVAVLILYPICYFLIKKNKKKNSDAQEAEVVEENSKDESSEELEAAPQEVESIDDIVTVESSEDEPKIEESQELESKPVVEEQAIEEVKDEPVAEETKAEPKVDVKEEKPVQKAKRVYKGKYEVYPSGDDYAYQLKASNGEVLIVSEYFSSRDSVLKSIEAVKKNLETGDVKIFVDKKGNYQFKLVSKNHRVLALSAKYSTEKSAISASNSFKKFAFNADIVDVIYDEEDLTSQVTIEVESKPKAGGKYFVEKYEGIFYWVLKANNGQILCQSNGYTSKVSCQSGIATFKANVETGVFKCVKDKNDTYCYKLYNQAGR
ncbi:MAG: DUF1508 domain-containing protein, partial [Acholeplasmatales bacterium]|nr:DUF1508 domain-containing protein [Acholeplasmatales bacterium]